VAITRIAKGAISDKSSALTLTINSISLDEDTMLVVGIGYDFGLGVPEIKWGDHILELEKANSGNGVASRILSFYRRRGGTATNNLVATWTTTAPESKAMFATQVLGASTVDQESQNTQVATTSPNAGTSVTSLFDDEIFIGCMVSEGPSNDVPGTPSNGYTSGQRVGTTGVPPVSNVTVEEIYKIVTATESTQAEITGTESRDWTCVLGTFSADQFHRLAVSPSDVTNMINRFPDAVPELEPRNLAWKFNRKENRLEVYDIDFSTGTLFAYLEPEEDWTVV